MNFLRNTAAAAFLCATAACTVDQGEQQNPKNVEVVQDATDWNQPVDRAVLTTRTWVNGGIDTEMLSFEEEPITLQTCRALAQNNILRVNGTNSASSVTCLNDGKLIGSFKFD